MSAGLQPVFPAVLSAHFQPAAFAEPFTYHMLKLVDARLAPKLPISAYSATGRDEAPFDPTTFFIISSHDDDRKALT